MRLKSLTLHGFKSFARKTTLTFDVSKVGVVGPNGSGKSNVVEGLRFVLGEQSMKSLRGGSGSDLVFRGDKDKGAPSVARAYVQAVFDNTDRIFRLRAGDEGSTTFEFDEVRIAREVYKDGTNRYLLNDQEVRLKDIVELISSVNIGTSSHHIISQGQADRLLNANAKERRAMIEDALGLKSYHYRIRDAVRKLEKTQDNIDESKQLRREIGPHLRYLSRQVEKVQKAQTLRQELETAYGKYFPGRSISLNTLLKKLSEEKQLLEKNSREKKELLHNLQDQVQKSGQESEEEKKIKSLIQESRNRISALQKEKGQIDISLGKSQGVIEMLQEQIRNLQTPLEKPKEAKVINKIIEGSLWKSLSAKVSILKKIIAAPESSLEEIKKACRELLETYQQIPADAEQKSIPQKPDTSEIEKSLQDRIDATKAEVEKLLKNREEKEGEIQSLENFIGENSKSSQEQVQEKARLHERFYAVRQEVRDLENSLIRNSEKTETLNQQRYMLQRDIQEAQVLAPDAQWDQILSPVAGAEIPPASELDTLRRHIERIQIKLEEAGTDSGEDLLAEYNQTKERDEFLAKEIDDLVEATNRIRETITDLKSQLYGEFVAGVRDITGAFNTFFTHMFGGGHAELSVVSLQARRSKQDEEENGGEAEEKKETEYGIDISVKLPRKKVQALQMLSGGERSLTSIALLFALSQVNPPPFLVLDETDAALDEANSRRYGDMLEKLSEISQLIVVTHNRETMTRANALYGVTLGGDGVSQILSVKFDDAVQYAK